MDDTISTSGESEYVSDHLEDPTMTESPVADLQCSVSNLSDLIRIENEDSSRRRSFLKKDSFLSEVVELEEEDE